ncbi:MAG: phosphoenolpyruvate carboxykinase (ATP) [Thermoplasmata archaeon]|nr:MAG: phosphoenolpyruvate carboxykinase (ATP) [Thermoplasmata archaeon]
MPVGKASIEEFREILDSILNKHENVKDNISRREMIEEAVANKEALISKNGALATWTPPESTGRSPKDTVIVRRPESEGNIDWDSPNNIPIEPETFEMVLYDALKTLESKEKIYVTDRVIGADPSWALPTRTVTDHALTALFTDNMFRDVPEDIQKSVFYNDEFTLLVLPYDKLDRERYEGRLRKLKDGRTSNMIVAMDFDNKIGVVYGSAYQGSVKKLMFTVMNYLLPEKGILPLHCSANDGEGGSALLLGLSGTGKTTLSADPHRALLGDDEHGWSDEGIANFENGCYAKMINIKKEKEPEIYNAVMHRDDWRKHGAIVENAMMYPNGKFDFSDSRLTQNSRASYPLTYLTNVKPSSRAGHPKTILFLTADANGVIPPVAKLNQNQAMLWFLMGYTSKLAGTETGIDEPVSVFSRFFGEPFMPRNPDVYATMLGEKMKKHRTNVYLINTGWTGGPYGVGERIDIDYTRAMVDAALTGKLEKVSYRRHPFFKVMVPEECPGVPSNLLWPRNTWKDKEKYDERAKKVAEDFRRHFEKAYGNKNIDEEIARECPGV